MCAVHFWSALSFCTILFVIGLFGVILACFYTHNSGRWWSPTLRNGYHVGCGSDTVHTVRYVNAEWNALGLVWIECASPYLFSQCGLQGIWLRRGISLKITGDYVSSACWRVALLAPDDNHKPKNGDRRSTGAPWAALALSKLSVGFMSLTFFTWMSTYLHFMGLSKGSCTL